MSFAEIVHRVTEQIALQRLRIKFIFGTHSQYKKFDPNSFSFCSSKVSLLPVLDWEFHPTDKQVKQWLAGEWSALGFDWQWRAESGCWRLAPDSGKEWPQSFFNSIQYRPGNSIGDVRVAWEPARLQQFICLALLSLEADSIVKQQSIQLIERQLHDWVVENPYMRGIHYVSAMESALRIIAVCYAVDIARENIFQESTIWNDMLNVIETHACLMEQRLSLYSSAGNHTIAEAVGLLYAGSLFPELKKAEIWKHKGKEILAHEADQQIFADGGGAEQTFWYLLFISDLLGLAHVLLTSKNESEKNIEQAFQRASAFLSCLGDSPSSLPDVGDRDDGYALSRFLRISFKRASGKNAFVKTFQASGYTLCKPIDDVKILFDHGALGMPPSYGHGHADALSLIVLLKDKEIFVDSGTYGYAVERNWRQYFKSTAAHNTVTVDDRDQATYLNGFMWKDAYSSGLIHRQEEQDKTLLLAKHNGYAQIGVIHYRGLYIDHANGVVILDRLVGDGNHKLTLRWHVGDELEVDVKEFVVNADFPLRISIPDVVDVKLKYAEKSELGGWKSFSYGKKSPITTIEASYEGALPHDFCTYISWGNASELHAKDSKYYLEKLQNLVDET